MTKHRKRGPYEGNILVQGLGPIFSRKEALKQLLYLPETPFDNHIVPKHERLHYLMSILDLHIPVLEGARIYESIDLMLRQSYRYRDPRLTETWRVLSGEYSGQQIPRAPAMASVVTGHAGTGKTQAILRALGCYPQQIIVHDNFPQLVGSHLQVTWLTVDVPASGLSTDLAANLMCAWDDAMAKYAPNLPRRFEPVLAKNRRDGQKMLDEWRQVALSHFLGVLHLDEIQNFFKLATLKQRRERRSPENTPELSIVEDKALRWILSLLNTWQIPVVISGTPDGVGAMTKRMSTTQRISTGGYHKLAPFPELSEDELSEDELSKNEFKNLFFKQLLHYQFVQKPLKDSPEFRQLVLELTGGVPRIIIALWVAAHRVAFERREDSLRLDDFQKAAKTLLAPVMPAVAALRSGDPELMMHYDDLMPRDDAIWKSIWSF